jgi:ERCC4-type nuclease
MHTHITSIRKNTHDENLLVNRNQMSMLNTRLFSQVNTLSSLFSKPHPYILFPRKEKRKMRSN